MDPAQESPEHASVAPPTPDQVVASQYIYKVPSEVVVLSKHHLIRLLERRESRQGRWYPPWDAWVATFGIALALLYVLDTATFKPFAGAGPAVIHALTLLLFGLFVLGTLVLLIWSLVGSARRPSRLSPEDEVAQILAEAAEDDARLEKMVADNRVSRAP